MILRFLYFIAIGWWLGILAAIVANLLCLSIIGMPFGVMILNRLPSLVYMREVGEDCPEGFNHRHVNEELPFLLRVLWFFVLGWELSFLTIGVGYVLSITIIGLPLGIYLLNRVPMVTTLSRHYAA